MNEAEKLKALGETLSRSKKVRGYDFGEEQEAWTLAHGFVDIEESFNVIYKELLPLLYQNDLSEEQIEEVLSDIGDEIRHIIYHIMDNRYFSYITDNIE